MADYENLLDSIDAVIKANNRREITGQILQNTLHQMVGSLGENYQLAGFATPSTNPNSPDQNVFYVTDEAGVYTNFDNITLDNGLSFLTWKNGEWASKTFGIVTAQWVDTNYVSKAFLRNMFRFYDEDGIEIFANDTTSIVDNIKAMCGLWTEQYLSALGLNSDYSVPSTLADLNDVTITSPTDGQALVYDAATSHWINATIQSGVDMTVVWAALAASTNEQIAASHLSTALSGYVTTTALNTTLASYVTTTALNTALAGYASQSWVGQNYVSIAFFNSIFEAQDSNGTAIAPNNAGGTTIDRLKILVGAYTEQYLSALGLSSGGSGSSDALADLVDVTISNPQGGQALIYDAATTHWINGTALNMSAVWTALADATNEQINLTHLTTALTGYVTSTSLSTTLASYVTSTSLTTTLADYVTATALTTTLASYATQTWVGQNYVSTAFFNAIFQLEDANGNAITPNNATTAKDRLKILVGAYTDQYLSALGLNSNTPASSSTLADLLDVNISTPSDGQALVYNAATTKWINASVGANLNEPLSSINNASLGSPSTANVAIVWNGTAWTYGTTGSSYTLPTASASVLGGIKVGTTLAIDASGVLNQASGIATAGTYKSVTVDTYGRVTAGTNPTTLAGYGITDAKIANGKITLGADSITPVTSLSGYATQSWVTTQLGSYLSLSGGTISSPSFDSLVINRAGSYYSAGITFKNSGDGVLGSIAIGGSANGDFANKLWCSIGNDNYHILHSGNSSVSKSGETLSVTINGVTQSLTNSTYSVNNATLSLQANGTTKTTFYANDSTNRKFNIASGSANGTISVGGTDVSVTGLGSNAYSSTEYLPLSGGTISSTAFGPLVIHRDSAGYGAGIKFSNNTDGVYASLNAQGSSNNYNDDYGVGTPRWNDGAMLNTNMIYYITGTESDRYCKFSYNGWINAYILNNSDGFSVSYCIRNSNDDNLGGICGVLGGAGDINYYFYGGTYSSPNMIIKKSTGNICIGSDANPSYRLQISASTQQTPLAISRAYDGHISYFIGSKGTSGADSYTMRIRNSTGGDTGSCIDLLYGDVYITDNLIASGGVSALSDIRHKNIIRETQLSVEQIAQMPSVVYRWNDGRDDNEIHVGSIAQDWQSVLPEVVMRANDAEGTLSLQYGVAACVSAITIAKRVVNHEARIKELEKENADLKQAYSFIKNAYEYLKTDYEQLKLKIA